MSDEVDRLTVAVEQLVGVMCRLEVMLAGVIATNGDTGLLTTETLRLQSRHTAKSPIKEDDPPPVKEESKEIIRHQRPPTKAEEVRSLMRTLLLNDLAWTVQEFRHWLSQEFGHHLIDDLDPEQMGRAAVRIQEVYDDEKKSR